MDPFNPFTSQSWDDERSAHQRRQERREEAIATAIIVITMCALMLFGAGWPR